MRVVFLYRIIVLFCFCCLIYSSFVLSQEYKHGGISLNHIWARATPLGSNVGVSYLEISVNKGSSDTLLSATSPLAAKVEIHSHTQEDEVIKMRFLEKLPLTEGQKIIFQPSGLHLMLIGLKKQLKEGERLPLTLLFEKTGPITVEAVIEPIGSQGELNKDRK